MRGWASAMRESRWMLPALSETLAAVTPLTGIGLGLLDPVALRGPRQIEALRDLADTRPDRVVGGSALRTRTLLNAA